MIDIENIVFTEVHNAIIAEFPNAKVYGEPVQRFATYPAIVVQEINNVSLRRTIGVDNTDNHATVTYEVNVFDDAKTGRKSKCKKIIDIVDRVLMDKGFYRIIVTRLPSQDRTVNRIYGRWRAIVGKPVQDGQNTVFYTYRQ